MLAFAGLGLLTPNPWVTFAGVAVIPVLIYLLWKPGEPPALLFAAGFQWVQVFTPILRADVAGERLTDPPNPELELAAWLGLCTILVLAVGMRIGGGRKVPVSDREVSLWVPRVHRTRLLVAYGAALFLSFVIEAVAWRAPAIRQLLLTVVALRWALLLLILWIATLDRTYRWVTFVIVPFEAVIGFGGFFSSFKFVFYLAIVALLARRQGRSPLFRPAVLLMGGLLLVLAVFWQAVKTDYRAFLNMDTGEQSEYMARDERYVHLGNQARDVTRSDLMQALETGIDRLGYLEYFARSIGMVPGVIPYQNGQLWAEAVMHVLTPRFLFPDKAIINDTLRTAEFVGDPYLARAVGTSVSLGYAAESYIDFGPVFMFLPILGLGLFWGWGFRWLATRTIGNPLGVAVATVFVMSLAILFESSNVKLLGGGLTLILVWTVLLRFWGARMWSLMTRRPWLPDGRYDTAVSMQYRAEGTTVKATIE